MKFIKRLYYECPREPTQAKWQGQMMEWGPESLRKYQGTVRWAGLLLGGVWESSPKLQTMVFLPVPCASPKLRNQPIGNSHPISVIPNRGQKSQESLCFEDASLYGYIGQADLPNVFFLRLTLVGLGLLCRGHWPAIGQACVRCWKEVKLQLKNGHWKSRKRITTPGYLRWGAPPVSTCGRKDVLMRLILPHAGLFPRVIQLLFRIHFNTLHLQNSIPRGNTANLKGKQWLISFLWKKIYGKITTENLRRQGSPDFSKMLHLSSTPSVQILNWDGHEKV